METQANNYGFSKKTNITIAAITALATCQNNWHGLIAISAVALVALTYQFIIEYKG